ncbi:MAG: alpha-galactosidase [Lachnospiraceae bacterium]|nr:alpha-galactosidase [Lachnospiraceae bacterium]
MSGYITHWDKDIFSLNTANTTYAFRVMEDCRYLEHLYYGRRMRIHVEDGMPSGIYEQHAFAPGNSINYDEGMESYTLENVCLEMSSIGKGDIREPFIEAVLPDGSTSLDFQYVSYEIKEGKQSLKTLPSSYDESGESEELSIMMKDRNSDLELILTYSVFPECDVITKSVKVKNTGSEKVRLVRLMSNQIDFSEADYIFSTFNGAWAREMDRFDTKIGAGKFVNSSFTGTSSNRANPFVMISKEKTTEDFGECLGFNLIYSGNHYEALEVNAYQKMRFVQGINPQNFEFILNEGEEFEAPEAVMTFSKEGFGQLSHNMHEFIREHIVRGEFKKKERPVLLNSWEASYFNIDRKGLLKLAKEGKKLGIELFVMDDGWFGERNDDSHSLGDWEVNLKKIPGGLKSLADDINAMGLMFGIWVEPEMVNVKSKLYEKHPEWVMDIPGKAHSEGRNQRILDLCNEEVQDYIIESMSQIFESANISYVKWDMNRIISDYYSKSLNKENQEEVGHRYVMGLYRCMDELTRRFPHILFEGCASGGNRFDLGILCYFPQIWASDNTDAISRAKIQTNYSYGYPLNVLGAHVSGVPNHQTLRRTPLETRFNVASFGVLGYECNFCDLKKEEKDQIARDISWYKKYRKVFQFGDFYRTKTFNDSDNQNEIQWTVVSKDQKTFVSLMLQKLVTPNWQYECLKPKGLLADEIYEVNSREKKINIKEFGDLVNTVAPIHIKQDSGLHNVVSKFVKMDSASENHRMYGDTLMYSGLKLKQSYSGTGYNEEVRYYQDFSSELFVGQV